jgi:putative spermidine/putrescine transport system permease protein
LRQAIPDSPAVVTGIKGARARGAVATTSRRPGAVALLVLPSAALFIVFFTLPFGIMAWFSLLSGHPVYDPSARLTLEHYGRMADDIYYLEVVWTTLRLGIVTTVVTLVLGYPLAHLMARTHSSLVRLVVLISVLGPLLTGIVVRTFAWMTILADQGVANQTLAWLGLAGDTPYRLMYNEFGIVVALSHIFVPFMVLTLAGVIGRIDTRLEEAARVLGAPRFRAFLEVTLPLSLPGIVAGSLLVFALAISSYVTPLVMGGYQITTLPILIYQQISANFNVHFAAALGVLLLAISLVLVVGYNHALARIARQSELV